MTTEPSTNKYKDAAQGLRGQLLGSFNATGLDLVGPDNASEAKDAEPNPELSAKVFDLGSRHGETLRGQFVTAVQMGNLDPNSTSVALSNAAGGMEARAKAKEEERKKQAEEDRRFLAMLDAINNRIRDLDKSMADTAKILKGKYGENYVDGMASKLLTEDELSKHRTPEERLRALAGKMLNPDGTLKKEYENTPEGQYVRDWQEREKAKELAAKFNAEGRVTPELKKEFSSTIGENFDKQKEVLNSIKNADAKEFVGNAMNNTLAAKGTTNDWNTPS